ncbi:unnamed protein product [Cochlearia groenlandica]
MGKWNSNRSRFHRRRSPMRWYSDNHSSEDDGLIPSWEKKFCEVIGSVPWRKVVESSSFKSWYQGNVMTWDDSACEETFRIEKTRFWSRFNGLGFDVSLPDPDMYISEVDWDTYIDPELVKDVERAYFAPPPDDVETGSKRDRYYKKSTVCDHVCVGETRVLEIPCKGRDNVDVLRKGTNGWDVSESSTDHKVRSCEAKSGFKRQRYDKNLSGFGQVCVEETSASDNVNVSGKKSNGWDVSESSADHKMGWAWEAKRSCGNEKANDTMSRDCFSNRWMENTGQEEDQNKKAKGSESVVATVDFIPDNPWEAKPSGGTEIAIDDDSAWGGCSGKGWDDSGWGSGQVKEWRQSKGYSRDVRDTKGCYYSPWKVADKRPLRDYEANVGDGWERRREASVRKERNWDVKRSSYGSWGRRYNERDDYKNIRPRSDDHYKNRKVR